MTRLIRELDVADPISPLRPSARSIGCHVARPDAVSRLRRWLRQTNVFEGLLRLAVRKMGPRGQPWPALRICLLVRTMSGCYEDQGGGIRRQWQSRKQEE